MYAVVLVLVLVVAMVVNVFVYLSICFWFPRRRRTVKVREAADTCVGRY